MFRVQAKENDRFFRLAVIGLLLMSAAALAVTIWVMIDFLHEQEIVEELIGKLPSDAAESAEVLAGELRWQFRLTILIVLNVVVTATAVAILWRAYRSSQESLRDLKALAGDILSSMDQAVITTDLNGLVTSINRRGLQMLNAEIECVGRSLDDLSTSVRLDDFRADWAAEQSGSLTRDFPTTSGGSDRVLRASCQSLSDIDDQQIGFVLQVRDVTDRVLIEDRMRRMERYMGLGSIAAGLHHEIRNPLAALSLHVQLLEEQLEDGHSSEDVCSMLDVIKTEVIRIGGVLEGFRDFASVERLNISLFSMRELLQRQVRLISPQASERSVAIRIQFSDELPKQVPGDQARLEQVFLNLLLNAMDAMPAGGDIVISVFVEAGSIVVEISDTGSGVPADLRDRVFDPYFTTKGKGTGLGLALCDKIIRQHNGGLDFRSTPQGTTFQLTLPCSIKVCSEKYE